MLAMNDLIVKNVDVMGDSIMAARDKDGVIWAGVSYFCNALGMKKWQKDKQIQKAQNDKTLKRGCSKFGAGVFDPNNETVALRLDFIPMWLAKITITDQMEKDHPELASKLLDYQLKAKDILAAAFLPKQTSVPQTIPEQIQLLAQGNVELNKRVDEVQEEVDTVKNDIEILKNDLPVLPVEADTIVAAVKKKGVQVLGGKQSMAYADRGLRQRLYNDLYHDLKRQFDVRTYKAIRRRDAEKAVQIIEAYTPPVYLEEQIAELNSPPEGKIKRNGRKEM